MSTKILLGITGGIAAYKTPSLVRLIVQVRDGRSHCDDPRCNEFCNPHDSGNFEREPGP